MDKTILSGTVEGEIDPPSSKSYAQRAIAAALLAGGVSTLRGVELCDDTVAALRVVQTLGAKVENTAPGIYSITGASANPVARQESRNADGESAGTSPRTERSEAKQSGFVLDIGESGLSTRLFTPVASLRSTPVTITGHGSILRRPMTMMTEPLRTLGVEVTDNDGHLPITVRGPMRGGEVRLDGSISSQFLTGLLVSLPLAERDTTIYVEGLKSYPYIDMTIDTMDKFGINIDHRDYREFYIPGNQSYNPADFTIEGDWSAASCLLVAGAVAGRVTVKNLNPVSLQADVAIIEVLSRAGALIEQTPRSITVSRRELRAFEFDATDCPDLFPALAALAANCEGTSVIFGTSRLAHKESNRAETLRSEYARLGIDIDISRENTMLVTGPQNAGGDKFSSRRDGVVVDGFGDHRIAMSLAVAALNADSPVTITGAECVSKSYGDFWTDFDNIRI